MIRPSLESIRPTIASLVGPVEVAVTTITLLVIAAGTAGAQATVDDIRLANPQAVEIPVVPAEDDVMPLTFRVSVFRAGDDPATTAPVNIVTASTSRTVHGQAVRLDLGPAIGDISDGRYFVAIAQSGAEQSGGRLFMTPIFVLYREAGAVRTGYTADDAAVESPEQARKERFWSRVGMAVAGGLLAMPLLLR